MKEMKPAEIKSRLLDILVYIDKILKKNNLNYSIAYGTLIGAARHKGFIPWDDDIDIVMPYSDYLKMLMLPELNRTGNRYTVHYSKNCQYRYNYPFAKIEDNYTKCLFKYTNDEGGVFVDVFPMTPLPLDNPQKYAKKLSYLKNRLVFTFWRDKEEPKFYLHELSSPLYKYYRNKLEKLAFKYTNSDYDYLIDSTWAIKKLDGALPKVWFNEYTDLEFEGYKLKAISNYEKWLEIVYGNWKELPPENERISHHNFSAFYKD